MAGEDQEGFLKINIDDFIGMWCFLPQHFGNKRVAKKI